MTPCLLLNIKIVTITLWYNTLQLGFHIEFGQGEGVCRGKDMFGVEDFFSCPPLDEAMHGNR